MIDQTLEPACPRCGCEDAREIAHGVRWGQPWTRRRCTHCFTVWTSTEPAAAPRRQPGCTATAGEPAAPPTPASPAAAPPDPTAPVPFHVLRCPKCRGDQIRTTGTQRPIRYHRCKTCGMKFRSREVPERPSTGPSTP